MMTTVKAKKALRRMTSVLLLVCLIAFCPLAAANAVELDPTGEGPQVLPGDEAVLFPGECSLTVYPASSSATEMLADLATANVVIDVYRVADGIADPVFDTYSYRLTEAFASLTIDEPMNSEKWTALAQQAAALVRDSDDIEPVTTGSAGAENVIPEEGSLTAGLYLLLAHSAEFTETDEIFSVAKADEEDEGEDAEESIVTLAQSDMYLYSFAPQLVSLPGKGDLDGATVTNTADNVDWQEHVTVYLKPSREYRLVDLSIVKTLRDEFVGTQDAYFVFRITATQVIRGEEKTVYSRVVMMSFSTTGTKTLTLEKVIPVGATVTVIEEYDGSSYVLVDHSEVPVIASAETPLSFSFTNSPDEFRPGEGVVNRFTHDETGDWPWSQIRDESDAYA